VNRNLIHIVHFAFVVIIQIFILNEITVKSSISIMGIPAFIPLLYPALILMLPVNVNYFIMMAYAFFLGLFLDYFGNTPGLSAAALVVLAYLRPRMLELFFQKDIKQVGNVVPSMYRLDFMPFIIYISIGIGIHHLVYYSLQLWSFSNIHIILFKLLLSGVLTILMIVIGQMIFYRRQVRKL